MSITFPQSVPLERLNKLGEVALLDSATGSESAGFIVRTASPLVDHSKPHPEVNGEFLTGFGNACTHMGCLLVSGQGQEPSKLLSYKEAQNNSFESIVLGPCPCHGTTFDLTRSGLVVLGPATQNLPSLNIRIDNTTPPRVVADGWANPHQIDPRVERWGEGIASPEDATSAPLSAPFTSFVEFINTADSTQLEVIPGVGPKFSEAIVRLRTGHPWITADDLAEIQGISIDTARKFADWYDRNLPIMENPADG